MLPELFRVELMDQSLVVTFGRPSDIVSWARLNGGFRSGVSHFLIRQFTPTEAAVNEERLLRQTAGRLKLKGTVAGVGTTANLRSRRTSTLGDDDLLVAVLALLPHSRVTPPTHAEPQRILRRSFHSPQLLVAFNKRLAHEEMLETMALAVQLRSRFWLVHAEGTERPPATAEVHWVAVSTFDEQRYQGDFRTVKALASKALAPSLKSSI